MNPLDELNRYIQAHNLRKSYERERVLLYIIELNAHFTIQSLHKGLNEKSPISRTAVYNIVNMLLEATLIVKHPFGGAESEYELKERALTHHHKKCIECGQVKEFSDLKFNKAIKSRKFQGFEQNYHSIYLYGICSKCKKKRGK